MKKPAWTCRSQGSLLKQRELEAELAKLEASILACEQNIAKGEGTLEHIMAMSARGENHPRNLGEVAGEVENERRTLEVLKKRAASVRSQIKALGSPSPSEKTERARHQARFVKCASERLATARILDGKLKEVRDLLSRLEKETAELRATATAIDLNIRDFAEEGVSQLSAALPSALAPELELWLAKVTGEEKQGQMQPYLVRREILTLPETLVAANVYRLGDEVYLSEEGARAILGTAPPRDPPIVERAAIFGSANPEKGKDLEIELLSDIFYGKGNGPARLYKAGVCSLPWDLALRFLLLKVASPVGQPGPGQTPAARMCVEGAAAAPVAQAAAALPPATRPARRRPPLFPDAEGARRNDTFGITA